MFLTTLLFLIESIVCVRDDRLQSLESDNEHLCVQGEQPGGVWRGAVLCTGHGDPWESFHSPAEGRRGERAGHRGQQGGVHQVRLSKLREDPPGEMIDGEQTVKPSPSFSQPADRLEVHARGGGADQSLPGRLQ